MTSIVSSSVVTPRVLRVILSGAVDIATLSPPVMAYSAWTITGTSAPPFSVPTVDSLVGVDSVTNPTTIDLTLAFDLSTGKSYTLTTTGLSGTGVFTVPALSIVSDRQFTLLSWVPKDDLRKDDTGDLRAFVGVLDDQLALLVDSVDKWGEIQDPDLAAEQFVDQMLVDLGNPIPDAVLTLAKKRITVKTLVPIFKQRGTGPGLINAIYFFLGLSADLIVANRQGMRLGYSLLGVDWVLGCGDNKWWLGLRVATPSGRAFTDCESRVLKQIIKLMRCAQDTIVPQAVLAAPTGVSAAASMTPAGITVSWSAVDGATAYAVYMRSVTGVTVRNGSRWSAGGSLSLQLPMLTGKHRYFIVVASNAQGDGLESAEVNAISG